MGVGAS
jgi:hypothetical protein